MDESKLNKLIDAKVEPIKTEIASLDNRISAIEENPPNGGGSVDENKINDLIDTKLNPVKTIVTKNEKSVTNLNSRHTLVTTIYNKQIKANIKTVIYNFDKPEYRDWERYFNFVFVLDDATITVANTQSGYIEFVDENYGWWSNPSFNFRRGKLLYGLDGNDFWIMVDRDVNYLQFSYMFIYVAKQKIETGSKENGSL